MLHLLPRVVRMPSLFSRLATERILASGLEILLEDHADELRPLWIDNDLSPFLLVAGRSAAAGPAPAVLRSVEKTAGHVAGQVTQVGVFPLLLDQVNQPAREVVPVDLALGDGFQSHPGVTEGKNPMATLDRIEPPETILVPTEHNGELALLGIFPHAKEPNAASGIVAADCFVEVLPEHVVAVLLSVAEQLLPLGGDGVLLPLIAHAEVETHVSGRVGSLRIDHVEDLP